MNGEHGSCLDMGPSWWLCELPVFGWQKPPWPVKTWTWQGKCCVISVWSASPHQPYILCFFGIGWICDMGLFQNRVPSSQWIINDDHYSSHWNCNLGNTTFLEAKQELQVEWHKNPSASSSVPGLGQWLDSDLNGSSVLLRSWQGSKVLQGGGNGSGNVAGIQRNLPGSNMAGGITQLK